MAYAPSSILTAKRARGFIKSFNATTGFGFIDCPELKELFGRDVFVHGKQFKGGYAVGPAVNFAIVLNKDNHPQAFDISEEGADEGKGKSAKGGKGVGMMDPGCGKGMYDPWGGKGFEKGYEKGYGKFDAYTGEYTGDKGYGKLDGGWGAGDKGFGKGEMKGYGKGDKGLAKGSDKGKSTHVGPNIAEVLGQSIGVIKSFSEKNGYGFIDCPEVKDMGYQDVFMHHQQMGNFKDGDEVVFTCYLNDKGNPQAKELMSQAQADRAQGGGGGGKSSGGPSGGKGKSPGGGPDVQETLGQMEGNIKSFNDKNGYGFISCAQAEEMGHKDVFLHHAQKGDFVVGDEVQFEGYLNKKGQVQARDLAA